MGVKRAVRRATGRKNGPACGGGGPDDARRPHSPRFYRPPLPQTHVAVDGGRVEAKQEPLVAARDDGRHGRARRKKRRASCRKKNEDCFQPASLFSFFSFPPGPPPQKSHHAQRRRRDCRPVHPAQVVRGCGPRKATCRRAIAGADAAAGRAATQKPPRPRRRAAASCPSRPRGRSRPLARCARAPRSKAAAGCGGWQAAKPIGRSCFGGSPPVLGPARPDRSPLPRPARHNARRAMRERGGRAWERGCTWARALLFPVDRTPAPLDNFQLTLPPTTPPPPTARGPTS